MRSTILFFLLCLPLWAQAQYRSFKGPITQVTVYPKSAIVSRSATLSLPAGQSQWELSGLSPFLDASSVRAEGEGAATLLSVSTVAQYWEPSQILDSLRKVSRQYARRASTYQAQLAVQVAELSILQENQQAGNPQSGMDFRNLQALDELQRKRTETLLTQQLETQKQLKTLDSLQKLVSEKINPYLYYEQYLLSSERERELLDPKFEMYYNQISEMDKVKSQQVRLSFWAKEPTQLELQLSYKVENAGWEPLYQLHIAGADSSARLEMEANIAQHTLEDWQQADISVCNTQPSEGSTSLYLYTMSIRNSYSASDKQKVPPTIESFPTVFEVSGKQSIPGQGQQQRFRLSQLQLPVQFEHYAVPKLRQEVYLMANLTGWQNKGLVDGPLRLFYDDTYLGLQALSINTQRDTLSFSMGPDPLVGIERKTVGQMYAKNWIGGRQSKALGYEITVRNNHRKPITLLLKDQLPVSEQEGFDVNDISYEGFVRDWRSGELKWKGQIAPGAELRKSFRFQISYPKDGTLELQ